MWTFWLNASYSLMCTSTCSVKHFLKLFMLQHNFCSHFINITYHIGHIVGSTVDAHSFSVCFNGNGPLLDRNDSDGGSLVHQWHWHCVCVCVTLVHVSFWCRGHFMLLDWDIFSHLSELCSSCPLRDDFYFFIFSSLSITTYCVFKAV